MSFFITFSCTVLYWVTMVHLILFILSENLSSADEDPHTIETQLESDLAKGRASFVTDPSPPFNSSPLGLVPKTGKGWRRIHHLSHPPGSSVNDHIHEKFSNLEYVTRAALLE